MRLRDFEHAIRLLRSVFESCEWDYETGPILQEVGEFLDAIDKDEPYEPR